MLLIARPDRPLAARPSPRPDRPRPPREDRARTARPRSSTTLVGGHPGRWAILMAIVLVNHGAGPRSPRRPVEHRLPGPARVVLPRALPTAQRIREPLRDHRHDGHPRGDRHDPLPAAGARPALPEAARPLRGLRPGLRHHRRRRLPDDQGRSSPTGTIPAFQLARLEADAPARPGPASSPRPAACPPKGRATCWRATRSRAGWPCWRSNCLSCHAYGGRVRVTTGHRPADGRGAGRGRPRPARALPGPTCRRTPCGASPSPCPRTSRGRGRPTSRRATARKLYPGHRHERPGRARRRPMTAGRRARRRLDPRDPVGLGPEGVRHPGLAPRPA